MGVPARPIPIPPKPSFDDKLSASIDDRLSACIAAGDCQRVRELFDRAFWNRYKISLTWEHLKTALVREDKPMVKLLVTWGAVASEAGLAQLWAASGSKYPRYLKLLRQCGAPVPEAAANLPMSWPLAPEADMVAMIPQEWKKVLEVFHNFGHREAVIAGGALRDLFNDRPVKDVDIFLPDLGVRRGGDRAEFLSLIFKTVKLEVETQQVSTSTSHYFGFDYEKFPDPKKGKLSVAFNDGYGTALQRRVTESWKIIAGPGKTEYNIVFVKMEQPRNEFRHSLVGGFDIGLCQIAYNGAKIITSAHYDSDVQNRRITLLLPNDTSKDHLQRIVKKYPDWKLCPEAKKLLAPKPKRSFWLSGGGCDTGPR